MGWTIQTNGELFYDEVSFEEFLEESEGSCPYEEDFREYWNEGKLRGAITNLKFDKNKKTYHR